MFRTRKMLATLSRELLHQAPLVNLTTSFVARMGERLPMRVPSGKHAAASVASTMNQTVSRRVFSWSKKPIGLYAAARFAHESANSTPPTGQRSTTTHFG